MSGRLTPAAITLIRISPGPGAGTGRVSGKSTSGPPGLLMPITVICAGGFSMICPCEGLREFEEHLISQPRLRWQPAQGTSSTEGSMTIEDDDKPRKKVTHEIGQDLSLLSVEELAERIALMTSEIERLQAAMTKKRASKDSANSIFKT